MNDPKTPPSAATLAIEGMNCGHCVRAVSDALSGVPTLRVGAVRIGAADVVVAEAGALSTAIQALEAAGFEASIERVAVGGPGAAVRRGGSERPAAGP